MMDGIVVAAQSSKMRIVLAEGEDDRIIEAAVRATADGLADIILLGDEAKIRASSASIGQDITGLRIIDPAGSPLLGQFAEAYHKLRTHRGVDIDAAHEAILNPLNFAAMMVRRGKADGTIGGAVATTADTVRAALQIIGKADDAELVSSFFLMNLTGDHLPRCGPVIFADCGLIAEPDAGELAEIAIASAANCHSMTGEEARVAMLSFSTKGSARHATVTKMVEAAKIAKEKAPDLAIDGELQFDAAFLPEVAGSKAPESPLRGLANVFVFPDLNAGNIGYKIAQRIGGAQAIGPILQGLAKPANDLSRGCNKDDVYNMIAVTALQAARAENEADRSHVASDNRSI